MSGCYCHGHWVFFYDVEDVWGLMVSNTLISKASPDRSRESITRQGGFSETCGWLTGALATGACPGMTGKRKRRPRRGLRRKRHVARYGTGNAES